MNITTPLAHPSRWVLSVLWSLGFTGVLFSLDEGYNDLRWMQSMGNWLMFAVYALPLFAGLYALFPALRALPGLLRYGIIPLFVCAFLFWGVAALMLGLRPD
ncbi:hypothetical protein GC167_03980 [bacterium]|nr:hypothetical protein [bacterium]